MKSPSTATRTALLDAAEALFSRRGYTAVGTREIAESASVNLAAIRYHFGSKHDLYLETVRRVMNRAEPEGPWSLLDEAPASREDAARRLAVFVRAYLERLHATDEPPACRCLMMWEAVQPSEAIDAVVRDYVRPSFERLITLVQRLVPEDSDLEPRDAARSILALILHEHVFRAFTQRIDELDGAAPSDPVSATRHIVRMSLRGLGHDDDDIRRALEAACPNSTTVPGSDTT